MIYVSHVENSKNCNLPMLQGNFPKKNKQTQNTEMPSAYYISAEGTTQNNLLPRSFPAKHFFRHKINTAVVVVVVLLQSFGAFQNPPKPNPLALTLSVCLSVCTFHLTSLLKPPVPRRKHPARAIFE